MAQMNEIANLIDKDGGNFVERHISVFNFNTKQVRTIMIDGTVWFVAKDVCDVLGIINNRDAISKLDEDEKGVAKADTLGGEQTLSIINESGLYSLTLNSNKPEAKKFKKWVTSEVIPSIRKTGSYSMSLPKTFSEALRLAADTQEKLEAAQLKIANDQPKVEFAERVRRLDGCCSVGEFAKVIGTGQNKMFKKLRDDGFLMSNNMPYQSQIDRGLFDVIELTPYVDRNGKSHPAFKTVVTGKGQVFFEKRYRVDIGLVVISDGEMA